MNDSSEMKEGINLPISLVETYHLSVPSSEMHDYIASYSTLSRGIGRYPLARVRRDPGSFEYTGGDMRKKS